MTFDRGGEKIYAEESMILEKHMFHYAITTPPTTTTTTTAVDMSDFTIHAEVGKHDFKIHAEVQKHVPSPGPVLGGYGGPENIGQEQKMIAAAATADLLAKEAGVTGQQCDHLTLIQILDFRRQVVAGTNFR